MPYSVQDKPGSKIRTLYQNYRQKGLFGYLGRSLLWILLVYTIFVIIVFLLGRYVVDFNSFLESFLQNLTDRFVLILFLVSESFLGLVPVDLFVVWSQKFSDPYLYLTVLGVLSYAGAIVSYGIGRWISLLPAIKAFSERRLAAYMDFARRWGAAFIIVAALFPFTPFSLVVIALALLKYPFRRLLLFALVRLVRFVAQGFIFFDLLQLDKLVG